MAFPYDAGQSLVGTVARVVSVLESHLSTELARCSAMHGITLPDPAAIVTGAVAFAWREGNRVPFLMVEGAETQYASRDGRDLLRATHTVHVAVVLSGKAIADGTQGGLHDALLAYCEAVALTIYDQVPDRVTWVKCEPPSMSAQISSRNGPSGQQMGQPSGARRVTIRIHTETPERLP